MFGPMSERRSRVPICEDPGMYHMHPFAANVASSSATQIESESLGRERPIRIVKMPSGWVAKRRLDKRLVVPNSNPGDAGQRGCDFSQTRVCHERPHARVRIRQLDALEEHL